jgi:hypothetical protein
MSTLEKTEARIEELKKQLLGLGPMRPGSLTRQFRDPKTKKRPFFQISYTHHMRSRSEYVRPEHLVELRRETLVFKRFKKLVNRWIDLALKASQLRIAGGTLERPQKG